ncbi:ubiquitin-domain-containing protein [Phanerochaete sordida]|uniref:Ubiquitin-domain-containing protein n=1 Tax=Phanerochaete sordida TaxID=48140 RepID=A0A9P3LGC9_9APHY|nr:ubiquitin-domain-containing protein [Phanerochaete sordida]
MDTIKLIKSRVEVKAGFSSGVLRFQFDGERLQDDMRLCDYNIPDGATIYLSICMLGGAGDAFQAREAGFAAGGKIAQKIVRDRLPATAYNFDAGCRLHISVLSPGALARLTGEPPIPTPISIETYLEAGLPWFDLYDEGIPSANNVSAAHPLAAVKSLQHMLAERADADPTKHRCCYCAATASFELRPCGHRLCWDCADGLPVDECPRRCRNVTERKTLLTDALAESEAGWDCPAAGTADERIIVLERCAAQGLVGTFLRAADRVSGLSSDA